MKLVIFALAALQLGLFAYFGLGFGSLEPISSMMQEQGFATLTGIALAVCLTPALILASVRRFLGVALALALVPITALGLVLLNL